MTTFHDQPQSSRRSVRHSDHAEAGAEVDAPARAATARTGRRAQLPSATEWRTDDAAAANAKKTSAETQQRAPGNRAPVAPASRGSASHASRTPAPVPAFPASVATADRVHPPRGRRASLPAGDFPPTSAIPIVKTAINDAAGGVGVTTAHSYGSSGDGASTRVASTRLADATPPKPAFVPPIFEHTMTRRELREARVAAERARAQEEVPEAIGAILNSGPILLPYLSSAPTRRVEEARAEFDALTREPSGHSPSTAAGEGKRPVVAMSSWGLHPAGAIGSIDEAEGEGAEVNSSEHPEDDDAVAEIVVALEETPAAPVQMVDVSADEIVLEETAFDANDSNDGPTESRDDAIFVEPLPTPTSLRSAGHWSVRAEMDEDIESLENSITRSVGSNGAITTSALVLPSVPHSADITTPYTNTGDVMVTGIIDLPSSLGATGVHPDRVDTSDFDVDPLDREVLSTDSAPVRAIRAVSTHTSSNGMITSKKPGGNRVLTVLVISASGMAVGVAGLLFAGFALNIF